MKKWILVVLLVIGVSVVICSILLQPEPSMVTTISEGSIDLEFSHVPCTHSGPCQHRGECQHRTECQHTISCLHIISTSQGNRPAHPFDRSHQFDTAHPFDDTHRFDFAHSFDLLGFGEEDVIQFKLILVCPERVPMEGFNISLRADFGDHADAAQNHLVHAPKYEISLAGAEVSPSGPVSIPEEGAILWSVVPKKDIPLRGSVRPVYKNEVVERDCRWPGQEELMLSFTLEKSLLDRIWFPMSAFLGTILTAPGLLAFWKDYREWREAKRSDKPQIIMPNDK